jgi:hypothetical protein
LAFCFSFQLPAPALASHSSWDTDEDRCMLAATKRERLPTNRPAAKVRWIDRGMVVKSASVDADCGDAGGRGTGRRVNKAPRAASRLRVMVILRSAIGVLRRGAEAERPMS